MTQLFANNAVGVLNGSIGTTATSIALVSGAVFPVPSGGEYFMATLIGLDGEGRENAWEIVKVIDNSLDILTVERAQEGTVAGIWGSGTSIELRITGLAFDNKVSKSEVIDSVESTATDVPLSANQGAVLKGMIDSINGLLSSDDVTLDQLQEIVDYIKTNRTGIDALGITSIAGLQTALDSKVDDSQVLTDVPAGAIFTDTTYSVGNGGLTEVNYTTALNTKLSGIEAGANNYVLPFTDNSANWNTAYGWGNHADAGYLAASSYTAADVLAKLKTVDGAGSGLDADTVDGIQGSSFLRSDANDTASGSYSFTNSYNEFGNSTGSVSNDGSWNARLNLAGSSHARLDVKSVSDGIITTMYSHTSNGAGKVGTMSSHPLVLMTGGSSSATLSTSGSLSTTAQGTLWGSSNDGAGSGLDADTVDGLHASSFALASHTHSYLPLSGGTLTGALAANAGISQDGFTILNGSDTWLRTNGQTGWYSATYGGGWYMTDSTYVRTYNNKSIYTAGEVLAGGNVTAYSDRRLKTNIEVIPDALAKVSTLSGYTFDRVDMDTARQTGVIAQEVQAVLPEAVTETSDGTLTVAYGNMMGLMIEAIKELKAEIDELKGVK